MTYATAYGGMVMSCAVREVYPRPATMAGMNRLRLENGTEIRKYNLVVELLADPCSISIVIGRECRRSAYQIVSVKSPFH